MTRASPIRALCVAIRFDMTVNLVDCPLPDQRDVQKASAPVSGHGAARISTATVWHAGRREWNGCDLEGACSQVKPLLVAVAQSDEPNPVQDGVFIATNFEHNCGGSAV